MIVGIYKMHIKEINVRNRVYSYHIDNLVKAKNLETKNILIDKKIYKDLTIYFTGSVHKMPTLHYYELMEKKLKNIKEKDI